MRTLQILHSYSLHTYIKIEMSTVSVDIVIVMYTHHKNIVGGILI